MFVFEDGFEGVENDGFKPMLFDVSPCCYDCKWTSLNIASNKKIVLPKGFVQYNTIITIIINSDSSTIP